MSEFKTEEIPLAEPQPSAKALGATALFMMKLATEEGTLKQTQAKDFQARARALYELGLELSAQFFGAELILQIIPQSIQLVDPTAAKPPVLAQYSIFYMEFHLRHRQELKLRLELLWEELKAFKLSPKRKRGGQKGLLRYAEIDAEIHAVSLKRWIEGGAVGKVSTCCRTVVKEYLSAGKLPKLGSDGPNDAVAAHVARLRANWPYFSTMFQEWKLNHSNSHD